MNIGVRYRRLGTVPAGGLRDAVFAQPEQLWWREHEFAQQIAPGRPTQHIYLCFSHGWPRRPTLRRAGWDPLYPAAKPVLQALLEHYPPGGRVLNAMLARLPSGERITRHRDTAQMFRKAHRIHVPLVTDPSIDFRVDGVRVTMDEATAVEINNALTHSVTNGSEIARIHFIVDYLPPENEP